MAVFEVIGYVYARVAYCAACGADLPYVDDFGNDRRRIYGWQREQYAYVEQGVRRYVHCPLCGKPANRW